MRRVIARNCIDGAESPISAPPSAISRAWTGRSRAAARIAAVSRQGDRVRDRLAGKTVLLTGGSGLPRQGRARRPAAQLLRPRRPDRPAPGAARRRPPRRGCATRCSATEPSPASIAAELARQARTTAGCGRSPATSRARSRRRREALRRRRHGHPLRRHGLLRGAARRRPGAQLASGPRRLLERLRRAAPSPHFVHVSTAYVADRARRRGPRGRPAPPRRSPPSTPRRCSPRPATGARRPSASRGADAAAAFREGRRAGRRAAAGPRRRRSAPRTLRRRWVAAAALGGRARRGRSQAGWPDTYALLEGARRTAAARALGADDDRPPDDHRVGAASGRSPAGWRASRSPTR